MAATISNAIKRRLKNVGANLAYDIMRFNVHALVIGLKGNMARIALIVLICCSE
jgi:cell division protein FtsX